MYKFKSHRLNNYNDVKNYNDVFLTSHQLICQEIKIEVNILYSFIKTLLIKNNVISNLLKMFK